ncbi:hypothetical protein, partial [Deminuibacter soli]|uniref:hypothetical protein n=1 Tax=Deminuibacter soli TaxID=2291815 RepID=UPI001B87D50F
FPDSIAFTALRRTSSLKTRRVTKCVFAMFDLVFWSTYFRLVQASTGQYITPAVLFTIDYSPERITARSAYAPTLVFHFA